MLLKNIYSRSYLIQIIESQRNFFEIELTNETIGTPLQIQSGYDYTVGYIRGADKLIGMLQRIESCGQTTAPEFVHQWIEECRDIHRQSLLHSIHTKSNFTYRLESYLFDQSLSTEEKNQRTTDLIRLWYFKGIDSEQQLEQPDNPLTIQDVLEQVELLIHNSKSFGLNMNAELQGYYAPYYDFKPYIEQLIEPSVQRVPAPIATWFDHLKEYDSNPIEAIFNNQNIVTEFNKDVNIALFKSDKPVESDIRQQAVYNAARGWLYGYTAIESN